MNSATSPRKSGGKKVDPRCRRGVWPGRLRWGNFSPVDQRDAGFPTGKREKKRRRQGKKKAQSRGGGSQEQGEEKNSNSETAKTAKKRKWIRGGGQKEKKKCPTTHKPGKRKETKTRPLTYVKKTSILSTRRGGEQTSRRGEAEETSAVGGIDAAET